MKATGIVRRIDDLGRVVIPKEIRRTMRIREGDPLEIYTDNGGEVIFKKYSPLYTLNRTCKDYADSMAKACGVAVLVCDNDSVLHIAGAPHAQFADMRISIDLEAAVSTRKLYLDELVPVTTADYSTICVMPIFSSGDIIGSISFISPRAQRAPANETEVMLIKMAADYIGRQLEV